MVEVEIEERHATLGQLDLAIHEALLAHFARTKDLILDLADRSPRENRVAVVELIATNAPVRDAERYVSVTSMARKKS